MPGVTRLELATSGVTDRQTQKLGKFNTSFLRPQTKAETRA
ncbi:uncharacterized protein METZ01_LOCUS292455 [marine metagenome]|uniref:Uncharacterized protein n=1 Tax=marine metagenome TaxID=408172 RepID=A0A382LXG9_9ZZZZ